MENQERQPRGFTWRPTDEIVINGAMFDQINKTLRFFENAITVLNIVQQDNFQRGNVKAFYPEDLNEDGTLREDFFVQFDEQVAKENTKAPVFVEPKTKKKKVSN